MEQLYSISAVTVLFVGLLVLYQVCRPFDWKEAHGLGRHDRCRPGLCCLFRAFQHTALTLQTALVLAVFLLLAQPAMHLACWLFEQGNRLYRRLKKYGTENDVAKSVAADNPECFRAVTVSGTEQLQKKSYIFLKSIDSLAKTRHNHSIKSNVSDRNVAAVSKWKGRVAIGHYIVGGY